MVNDKRCRSGALVQARRARVAPPCTEFLAFKRLSRAVEIAGEHAAAHRPHPTSPRRARLLRARPHSPTLTCACVRHAGVDAFADRCMPEDVVRHIASFLDGKTARRCARVCRVLAERARTHEDLQVPVEVHKYIVKGAAITLSLKVKQEQAALKQLHHEIFSDSEEEDDDIPELLEAHEPPGRGPVHLHAIVWGGACAQ
jgi:hypothetical protein